MTNQSMGRKGRRFRVGLMMAGASTLLGSSDCCKDGSVSGGFFALVWALVANSLDISSDLCDVSWATAVRPAEDPASPTIQVDLVEIPPHRIGVRYGRSVAIDPDAAAGPSTFAACAAGMTLSGSDHGLAVASLVSREGAVVLDAEGQREFQGSANAGDDFGVSVTLARAPSLDRTRLVVGAPRDDVRGMDSGTVLVLDWSPSYLVYVNQDRLEPAASAPGAHFGHCVALSGDLLAVGAPFHAGHGTVTVFDLSRRDPADFTEPLRFPLVEGPTDGSEHRFGWSVAFAGDLLVIGAPGGEGASAVHGAVHAFRRSGDSFVLERTIPAPTSYDGVGFGAQVAVAVRGDRAMVVASGTNGYAIPETTPAALYSWTLGSPPEVVPVRCPIGRSPSAGEPDAASAVAIDPSTDRVVVGLAPPDAPGYVQVYVIRPEDCPPEGPSRSFTDPVATVRAPQSTPGDRFGSAVGVSKGRIVVGAPGSDLSGQDAGAVYYADLGRPPAAPAAKRSSRARSSAGDRFLSITARADLPSAVSVEQTLPRDLVAPARVELCAGVLGEGSAVPPVGASVAIEMEVPGSAPRAFTGARLSVLDGSVRATGYDTGGDVGTALVLDGVVRGELAVAHDGTEAVLEARSARTGTWTEIGRVPLAGARFRVVLRIVDLPPGTSIQLDDLSIEDAPPPPSPDPVVRGREGLFRALELQVDASSRVERSDFDGAKTRLEAAMSLLREVRADLGAAGLRGPSRLAGSSHRKTRLALRRVERERPRGVAAALLPRAIRFTARAALKLRP